MLPLATQFEDATFTYTQIERQVLLTVLIKLC